MTLTSIMHRHLPGALIALAALSATPSQAAYTFPASVTPAHQSIIKQWNGINLTYQNVTEITEITFKGEPRYTYTNNASDAQAIIPGHRIAIATTRDKSGIRVYFPNEVADSLLDLGEWPVTAPGLYHVELPAITLTDVSGKTFDIFASKFDYTLIPDAEYAVSPNPANKVSTFKSNYTIAFTTFTQVSPSSTFTFTLTDPEGNAVETEHGCYTNQFSFAPRTEQTTGGTYKATLPAGALILSGEGCTPQLSPEVSIEINVERSADGRQYNSLMPADGSIIERFNTVSMNFEATPHVNRDCTELAKVYIDDELAATLANTAWGMQFASDNDKPTFASFTFTDTKNFLTTPGSYRVEIPEGFLLLGSGGDRSSWYPINAITLHYTVPRKFQYTLTPTPGSHDTLGTFTITFPEVESLRLNPLTPDEEGNGIIQLLAMGKAENILPTSIEAEGKSVTIICPEVTEPGTYVLEIPTGAFTLIVDGQEHLSTYLDPHYYIDLFPKPTVTPAEGTLTRLDEITLTLADCCTFGTWLPSQKFALWKDDGTGTPTGDVLGTWSRPADTSYKGSHTVTLTPDDDYQLPDGKYLWGVNRRSSFSVECSGSHPGGFNQSAILYSFEIKAKPNESSAQEIATSSALTIYSAAGILLHRDADPTVLTTLPRGLYIINGRKVIL